MNAFQKKILVTDSPWAVGTSKLADKADSATEANGIHIRIYLVEIY